MGIQLQLDGEGLAPGVALDAARGRDAHAWGSVWPVSVAVGATCAIASALGAWAVASWRGALQPWGLFDWLAEHALWGIALGALLALVLRLCVRFEPALADPRRRRAAAARITALTVGLALTALAGLAAGPHRLTWVRAGAELTGAFALPLALVLAFQALGRGRRAPWNAWRLDPARVAAALALVTLPLASGLGASGLGAARPLDGSAPLAARAGDVLASAAARSGDPQSLVEAWRVLLGR